MNYKNDKNVNDYNYQINYYSFNANTHTYICVRSLFALFQKLFHEPYKKLILSIWGKEEQNCPAREIRKGNVLCTVESELRDSSNPLLQALMRGLSSQTRRRRMCTISIPMEVDFMVAKAQPCGFWLWVCSSNKEWLWDCYWIM